MRVCSPTLNNRALAMSKYTAADLRTASALYRLCKGRRVASSTKAALFRHMRNAMRKALEELRASGYALEGCK